MKTVFITNRGGTHPNRILYFNSIKSDFQFVDFRIRWHGASTSKLKMLFSGIVCAFSFPKKNSYKLFITSDPQLPAILMKIFGLLRKDQKVISYLGSQTLYFIQSKYFSKATQLYYRFLLSRYDAHICNGDLQASLLKNVAMVPEEKIYVNFNGIRSDQINALQHVIYNPEGSRLLFIGNIYSPWRIHYKGLDLILDAYNKLKVTVKDLSLTIVGEFEESLTQLINKSVDQGNQKDIFLIGKVDDVSTYLNNATLYVHPSRGDALPNSLTEALYAGIPAVVTSSTGGCEIVERIDKQMVCGVDSNEIADTILYYLMKSNASKMEYSENAKLLTRKLTETEAIARFQAIVSSIEKL